MKYHMKEQILLRDVGGIYFLVDCKEKFYAKDKKVVTVNKTGKEIVRYLFSNSPATEGQIADYLFEQLANRNQKVRLMLGKDVSDFLKTLVSLQYIEVLENGKL
jgi:DNA-binding ferritin-like protein (Dps family)